MKMNKNKQRKDERKIVYCVAKSTSSFPFPPCRNLYRTRINYYFSSNIMVDNFNV